jgi:hypothetical protein
LYFPDWSNDGSLILFGAPLADGGGFSCKPDFTDIRQVSNFHQILAYPVKWASKNGFLITGK